MSPLGVALVAAAAGVEATAQHAAQATEELSLGAELEFLGVGLAIVLGTLAALWWLTALMGWFFVRGQGKSAAQPVATASVAAAPAAPAAKAEEVPIAAIAAAVAVVFDAPHRILAVEPQRQDWAVEGRRRIFASHQLR